MQKHAAGLTYGLLHQLMHRGSLERLLQVQHLALVGKLRGATDCLHATHSLLTNTVSPIKTSCKTSEELSRALPCGRLESGKGCLWGAALS